MNPQAIHTTSFAEEAAAFIAAAIEEDIQTKGRCVVGLCGGSTPRPVYEQLAKIGQAIDWSKVTLTFGDERCVPPDHSDSNFNMAKQSLLSKINIPAENVIRMEGEIEPRLAADHYEEKLRALPPHDLTLLGIGDDGHTASLFPGTEALSEESRLAVANFIPKLNTWRLTQTFKCMNLSRRVCFLVNDEKKRHVIDKIAAGSGDFPAGRVQGTEQTVWFLGYE